MIGLDRVRGWLSAEAVRHWSEKGHPTGKVDQLSVTELAGRTTGTTILDVRGRSEWDEGHVPGAVLIPLAELPERLEEVPADRPVAVHCQGGGRSAIAAALLLSRGRRAANVPGGFGAWQREGLPVTR